MSLLSKATILVLLLVFAHIILISSSIHAANDDAVTYEFKGTFPPVRLTYSDLEAFLSDLEHLYESSPGSGGFGGECTYELANQDRSVSGPSIDSIINQDRLLSYADKFRISCFSRGHGVNSIDLSEYPSWGVRGTVVPHLIFGQVS